MTYNVSSGTLNPTHSLTSQINLSWSNYNNMYITSIVHLHSNTTTMYPVIRQYTVCAHVILCSTPTHSKLLWTNRNWAFLWTEMWSIYCSPVDSSKEILCSPFCYPQATTGQFSKRRIESLICDIPNSKTMYVCSCISRIISCEIVMKLRKFWSRLGTEKYQQRTTHKAQSTSDTHKQTYLFIFVAEMQNTPMKFIDKNN